MSQSGGNNKMVFVTAMSVGVGIIVLTLYLSGALSMQSDGIIPVYLYTVAPKDVAETARKRVHFVHCDKMIGRDFNLTEL